ncbi:DNA-processing protein DprA [Sphingomicrobium marinum]|uniref:DNA-processing protein DprA n=1 Tax=Sphingomicrobium marinum TaxID=1227950 RepID=UPI00224042E5|nr:DNA-processing protein DprA [Sphingomicrobium marinum]
MNDDLVDRLRLIRTPRIGPVTHKQLMMRFGSAGDAIAAIPDLARRGRGRPPKVPQPGEVMREIEAVQRLGGHHLVLGQGRYPRLLATLEDAPPVLSVKGNLELLDKPAVAMVGARNASAAACRFARQLAGELGRAGQVVVSGLARGIDSAAHDGSLESGTIGVIAGGLDVVYPPQNEARQADIAERGLLVAEMPPGTEPRARHFPYRNRVIAGLAAGTVVVEAAPKSGSLITARLAGEMGREVMAVPGSPLDPRARGGNRLIKDGATLIENADDVLACLGPLDDRMERVAEDRADAPSTATEDDAASKTVEDLLGPVAVGVDEIVRQSGLPPAQVQLALLELDLADRLDRHAGGRVSLR